MTTTKRPDRTSSPRWWPTGLLAVLLASVSIGPARSEVVQIEIDRRGPFADGHSFGQTGPYERITGSLWIEVVPSHPANRRVVDLSLAPTTPAGKVRFRTDFFLLRPTNPQPGDRRLLYDVNNRGNKLALAAFNEARSNDPVTLADAGNGFLMRQGYAILWCGWNGDVMPGNDRLLIDLPVARRREADGTITGRVYSEICVNQPSFSEPLCWGDTRVYPAADVSDPAAALSMRPRRSAPPVEIPREQWSFARRENGVAVPDPTHLYLEEGFRPGWLYDLVYTARDPRVSGLGAVAVRDAVSFFRYAGRGKGNPLADTIDHAYAFGISQSGRFINHVLFRGFNGDEENRTVFDGAFIHVGGGGKAIFNRRFAQITRHGSQHEENLYPSDVFPFTTVSQRDPVTGREGDFLEVSRRSGHLPRIIITQTSTEYWNRGGSLLHTDVDGRHDVGLDQNVRLYHITGAHHLFFTPTERGICQHPMNALDYQPLLRALLVALDRWVTLNGAPPPSRHPRIADGTLVLLDACRRAFPEIPGVSPPEVLYAPLRLDVGPRWEPEGTADHVPPEAGPPYRTLVPAVDADGNELAGVRMPDLAVPLATHAGWNQRAAEFGAEGMLARWVGSSWPFPRTTEDRHKSNDPRPSVRERYHSRAEYLARIMEAVTQLRQQGFLLQEDIPRIRERAAERQLWDDPKPE